MRRAAHGNIETQYAIFKAIGTCHAGLLRPFAIQIPLLQSMLFETPQAALVREICRLVTNALTSIEIEMSSALLGAVKEKQLGPRPQGYKVQGR